MKAWTKGLLISLIAFAALASSSARRDVASPQGADVQYVEGFARIVYAPGATHAGGSADTARQADMAKLATSTLDFRGPTKGWWTLEWWRHPERVADPYQLIWETGVPPRQADTIFSFVCASPGHADYEELPPRARIYLNDEYLLAFPLGVTLHQGWEGRDAALEFIPKHVQLPFDGYHREFQAYGNSGIYRLRVSAHLVRAGVPNRIKVVVEPSRQDAISRFGVFDRTDTLAVNTESNAEQVAQLQQEVIQLKRVVNGLARRVYPELQPRRL